MKRMSAIRKLDDDSLLTIMKEFLMEIAGMSKKRSIRWGVDGLGFVLWSISRNFRSGKWIQSRPGWFDARVLSSIRILPNNVIVGGFADIATGVSFFSKS